MNFELNELNCLQNWNQEFQNQNLENESFCRVFLLLAYFQHFKTKYSQVKNLRIFLLEKYTVFRNKLIIPTYLFLILCLPDFVKHPFQDNLISVKKYFFQETSTNSFSNENFADVCLSIVSNMKQRVEDENRDQNIIQAFVGVVRYLCPQWSLFPFPSVG